MLSYQHGFHAGNGADVLKHAVLDLVLRDIAKGPRPVLYVETHSGRGRYDLTGAQARKGGEADAGILALLKGDAPAGFGDWLGLAPPPGRGPAVPVRAPPRRIQGADRRSRRRPARADPGSGRLCGRERDPAS